MTEALNILRFGQDARGTPVFLIHGFTGDAQRWVFIEEAITARHPMHAVEMPNHGASPKRPIVDFDALVDEVAVAFDACGFDRAHLVGHSLGGAVALALAAKRPNAVSLSLLAPAGLGSEAAADVLQGLATSTQASDLRHWLQHLVSDTALITDDFVDLAVEIRADAALREAQSKMGQTLFPGGRVSFDLVPLLARLTQPVQIIWGKEDAILSWEHALRAPGHVALHLFDQMGHIPQLEAPEPVAGLLVRHFGASEAL